MSIYLDCNATTPIEPRVRDVVLHHLEVEFGNEGSRTHEYGARARQAVQHARDQVAGLVRAKRDEVIFTSGATEANNIAILGLAEHGLKLGRRHVVSSAIEHKAVLEPLEELRRRGFAVSFVPSTPGGWVDPDAIRKELRPETLLVSVMHVNNETGVVQPLAEIAKVLGSHEAYFHVDAAQGFGKELGGLVNPRVDLISVSGHKLFAPKGIGALVARRRGYERPPLQALMYGGGQERGLRPGTLPVHLIAGFGEASDLAGRENATRLERCGSFRSHALEVLLELGARIHGDPEKTLPHTLNFSIPGTDSEALMIAWKGLAAVSNGSACTSHSYKPSHVLEAMGLPSDAIQGAIRMSWCHLTPEPDWGELLKAAQRLQAGAR